MKVRTIGRRLLAASLCCLLILAAATAAAQKKAPAGKKAPAAGQCTVSGKVTDMTTGKPLAGYPIMVFTQHAGSRKGTRVVTDRNGVYRVSVPRGAEVICYVTAHELDGGSGFLLDDAWLRGWRPQAVNVSKDTRHDFQVKLQETRDVAVTVSLPDGKPASGAQVLAGRLAATTKADGRASLKVPKKGGQIEVMALSGDRSQGACASLSAGQTSLALRLEPLRTFTGTLTDTDGKPAQGVAVMAMPLTGGEPAYATLEPVESRTDAQGKFQVKGLPAAEWMIFWDKAEGIKRGQAKAALKGDALEPVKAETVVIDPALFEGSIGRTPETKIHQASSFALDPEDNILVCDEARSRILKVSPDDRLLATWELPFNPEAIDVRQDGSVLAAGHGSIALLDASGTIKATGNVPGRRSVPSITHEGSEVFVCVMGETGFAVYRMKDDFKEPRRIINNLSGCCGQMDIRAHKGFLYAAENTRFSVGKYSLEGKKLADFVHSDSKKPSYYGEGCCEPKNLCFGPDGSIYTAASGKMEVKRYAPDGKFLAAVGHVPDSDGSCVRVTLGISRDGKRVYILDTGNNVVRLVKQQ